MKINGVRFSEEEIEVLRKVTSQVKEADLPAKFDVRLCDMSKIDQSAFEGKLFEAQLDVTRTSDDFIIRTNPIVDAIEAEETSGVFVAKESVQVSRVEILEEIDSGLFGKVYKARQPDLDRVIAVKIIKPEWKNQADAMEHARRLAKVDSHPNIVTTHAVEMVKVPQYESEMPGILMEWLDGETIAARLSGPRFTQQEVRRVCHGVLDGIEHMHSRGIAHGDLHFGNVILESDCTPRIIDIDASKDLSLVKLSTVSRDGAVGADVDYCRRLIHKSFAHGLDFPSVVNQLDEDLAQASTLKELRSTILPYLRGETPIQRGTQTVRSIVAETRDSIVGKTQQFIEENKPTSLHGLITNSTIEVCSELRGERFTIRGDSSEDAVRQRIADYEQLLVPIASALAVGCFWGGKQHCKLWGQCIEDVTNVYEEGEDWSGKMVLRDLRLYPTLLLLYAGGMGAFLNDKFATLNVLFRELERYHMKRRVELAASAWQWKADSRELWNSTVLDNSNRFTPVSEHLEDFTFGVLRGLVNLRTRFVTQFDRFEYFAGLLASFGNGTNLESDFCWGPVGSFLWRCKSPEDYPGVFFLQKAEADQEDWPPFKAGLLGGKIELLSKGITAYDKHVKAVRTQWGAF